MSGFKKFLLRGNVIELAVAVVIGAAFTSIVNSFVKDLLTPLISMFGGLPDFGNLVVTVGEAQFRYGSFINAVVAFLMVATVVYFLVVRPYERITSRFTKEAESTTRECPECLSEIPRAATRCANCTVQVPPLDATSV
ncbi:large conductance mechanosensitive channel [Thermocatellispora tengchongensis]|uniref:Large-conductance mechanosensitive channel n=1 Tax=Thermocatellispora tengchongensis TaxID=1073253 RepID=A0A840P3C9_9ACTN|nr:large conductance mechanosensitive channel protein MscL [Thermocatellispora tengchongensis]MBB5134188.1 large conductance mechanosensitive channel [Thermocatellispora tengchongensis]